MDARSPEFRFGAMATFRVKWIGAARYGFTDKIADPRVKYLRRRLKRYALRNDGNVSAILAALQNA